MNNFAHCSTVSEPRELSKGLLGKHDLLLLREHYRKNPNPSEAEMKEIANQLNIRVCKVKKWFYDQQRRAVKKGEYCDIQNQRVIKGRRWFTSEQRLILRKAYNSNSGKIPESKEMEKLAAQLKENDLDKIKKWFYRQKYEMRKKQLTVTNSSLCKSSCLMFIYIGLIWQIQNI